MPDRKFLLLLLLLPLLLCACGHKEEQAQTQLSQAEAVQAKGDLAKADALLQKVVASYPGTKAAAEASRRLQQVRAALAPQREKTLQKLVLRFRDLIDGYRAMYGHTPASLQEIDKSGYFFDSKYIADVVPADCRVYLDLGKSGYRVWAFQDQAPQGEMYDSANSRVEAAARQATLQNLSARGNARQLGNLFSYGQG